MCLIHCFARSRDHRARAREPINRDPEMTRKSPASHGLRAGGSHFGTVRVYKYADQFRLYRPDRRRRLADRSRREARVCTRRVHACERAAARLALVD